MHCRRRAPELSATSRLVSICIIGRFLVSAVAKLAAIGDAPARHAFLSFSTTHRLFLEMGLLSSIQTTSPTL